MATTSSRGRIGLEIRVRYRKKKSPGLAEVIKLSPVPV